MLLSNSTTSAAKEFFLKNKQFDLESWNPHSELTNSVLKEVKCVKGGKGGGGKEMGRRGSKAHDRNAPDFDRVRWLEF